MSQYGKYERGEKICVKTMINNKCNNVATILVASWDVVQLHVEWEVEFFWTRRKGKTFANICLDLNPRLLVISQDSL
jgi:hypothetical protein